MPDYAVHIWLRVKYVSITCPYSNGPLRFPQKTHPPLFRPPPFSSKNKDVCRQLKEGGESCLHGFPTSLSSRKFHRQLFQRLVSCEARTLKIPSAFYQHQLSASENPAVWEREMFLKYWLFYIWPRANPSREHPSQWLFAGVSLRFLFKITSPFGTQRHLLVPFKMSATLRTW